MRCRFCCVCPIASSSPPAGCAASGVRGAGCDNGVMVMLAKKERAKLVDLANASFESTFVRELPADPVEVNMPRQVADACYTRVAPTPVAAPRLLAWSDALGELLGLAPPSAQALEALG